MDERPSSDYYRRQMEVLRDARLRRAPLELDQAYLSEFEHRGAIAGEALSERWLASAKGRGLVSVDQRGDTDAATTWLLTDSGRELLRDLRDKQKLIPRAMWQPIVRAAGEGALLAVKTYVAAVPVALVAWWWGLITVSGWVAPVVTAAVAFLLAVVGLQALVWRRRQAKEAPFVALLREQQMFGAELELLNLSIERTAEEIQERHETSMAEIERRRTNPTEEEERALKAAVDTELERLTAAVREGETRDPPEAD